MDVPPSVMNMSDFFPQSVHGSGVLLVSAVGLVIVMRKFYLRKLPPGAVDWFHPVGILKLIWRFGSRSLKLFSSWLFQCLWRKNEEEPDFYCDYDSTWDSEEDSEGPERPPAVRKPGRVQDKFDAFCRAARDMQTYRHRCLTKSNRRRLYPHLPESMPNLNFYLGRTCSQPDGVYIKEFHSKWRGQYNALERSHTFIQWLFPLMEPGMNYAASPLTEEEVEAFCQSREAKENLLESYKLMLDFYGIELISGLTGEVRRAENWEDMFNNLNRFSHNNLRITRILKCLGILGYQHLQAPLVHFFLNETLVEGKLPSVKHSVLNYFVFAVRDQKERQELLNFAFLHYKPQDEFVWCPRKIQRRLQQQQQF